MSITTYAELKTAVARWMKRTDLTDYLSDYIALAENRFWYGGQDAFPTKPLRIRAMQEQETGSVASGAIAFPTSHLETINLRISTGGQTYPLRYLAPQVYAEVAGSTDTPQYYTFLDNAIKCGGTGSGTYIHDYYMRMTALSDSNTTNWLLTNSPNVYLFGACLEAALDIASDSQTARFGNRYMGAINAITNMEKNAMAGGSLAVMVGR